MSKQEAERLQTKEETKGAETTESRLLNIYETSSVVAVLFTLTNDFFPLWSCKVNIL